TVSGASQYQWCWSGSGFPDKAVPGGYVWSGAKTNRLTIKGSDDAGGTYWLRAINSCGTTVSNAVSVTISRPPVNASNSSPVCEGEPLKLIGTSLAGGVFEWTGPNGFKSTLQNPIVSDKATPQMAGEYSFKVTLGSCVVILTTTVTVKQMTAFNISNSGPVCAGGAIMLSGAPDDMSSYSWTGPNGFSASSSEPTLSDAIPAMAGVYELTVVDKNGCSRSATTNVIVNTKPKIVTQPEDVYICQWSTAKVNVEAQGASSYQWHWSGSGMPDQVVPGPPTWVGGKSSELSIDTKTRSVSGDYWVTATSSCGSVVSNKAKVTVFSPPVYAASSGPVCEGEPLTLIASGATGTYLWTGPNGFTSTLKEPTVAEEATLSMAGEYILTVKVGTDCYSKATTEVVVNGTPSFAVSNNAPVCVGEILKLTGPSAAESSFSWTGPNGFLSSEQSPVVSENASIDMSGQYTLTVTNSQGCSSVASTNVKIGTLPVITSHPVNISICERSETSLSVEASNANSYQWFWDNGKDGPVPVPPVNPPWDGRNSATLNIQTSVSIKGYYWVEVSNDCGTVVSEKAYVHVYSMLVGATYPGPTCEDEPLQLFASGVTGTYSWIGPAGFTSTERNPTVSLNATLEMAGTYKLTTTTQNGCFNDAIVNVEVKRYCVEPFMNYVAVRHVLKGEVYDESTLEMLSAEEASLSFTYYDGLGRPLQKVDFKASPSKRDIIQPIKYDDFGRVSTQYLSYVDGKGIGNYRKYALNTNHAYSDQYRFYSNFYGNAENVAHSSKAFSQSRYDQSPLNRIVEQGASGEAWQLGGATVKYDYLTNTDVDKVLVWLVNDLDLPETSSSYKSRELHKTVITDEEKGKTITFVNKRGETVLKRVQVHENGEVEQWADTYYIYDDFGNLKFVLPPMANEKLNQGAAIDDIFLFQWCFSYKYDGRKRMIEKRVPGSDWVYMVYDDRDRLVLIQDGNQRDENVTSGSEWTFTKYDQLNRPVATGIYTHPVVLTQEQMQIHVNGMVGDEDGWYEIYNGNNDLHGYTDQSFPKGVLKDDYLTITYYDNYSFKSSQDFGSTYDYDPGQLGPQATYTFPSTEFDRVKGQITGSKVKVLDGSSTWLSAVTYYDNRYRVIQTITESSSGDISKYSTLYNFPGWVLATKNSYQHGTDTYEIKKRYTYDHAGRLMQGYHELIENGSGQGEVLLAENEYNELGELVEKNLHVENGTPHQSIDYRYNIRGWLESVNNSTLLEETGVNVDDANADLFGMELFYNNPLNGVYTGN
ncbi:DUF6443 domain-containing protein, partial [Fulvivirga kasyanovii]